MDEKLLPAAPLHGVTASVINTLSLEPRKMLQVKDNGKYQLYLGYFLAIILN